MKITYSDRTSMLPKKDGVTDEFMLNGHFKEAYLQKCIDEHEIVRRLADNIIPDYLVYECDSLPLEDQLKIIENFLIPRNEELKLLLYSRKRMNVLILRQNFILR